jgi:hypothetical protein
MKTVPGRRYALEPLVICLLLASLGCAESLPERLRAVSPEHSGPCDVVFVDVLHQLAQGPYFPESRLIFDQAEWCRLWSIMRPTEECDTSLVDFDREAAVVVALGVRMTGGYSVKITCIQMGEESDAIQVFSVETAPGAGCWTEQALTFPVDIVKIDRSTVPATFEKSIVIHDCE